MPSYINMPSRVQEIQRYKNEIHTLKEQLKNSKQISKFVYNNITNTIGRFQKHHHLKTLRPFHEQATLLLQNPRDKVKTIKQFKEYKPIKLVQVNFRIFRGIKTEDEVRMDAGKGKNGRPKIPDEYIEYSGGYYTGHIDMHNNAEIMTLTNVPLNEIQKLPFQPFNIMVNRHIFQRNKEGLELQNDGSFTRFVQKVNQEENKTTIDTIYNVVFHYPIILIIDSYEVVGNQQLRQLPSQSLMQLRKDDRRMTNRFLTYEYNPKATSMKEMFLPDKYYIDNSCLANAIMNLVADKYNKAYKKKEKLSYHYIAKLTGKTDFFNKEGYLPLSFEETIPVFEHLRIRAEQRHENGSLEASYSPEKVDTFIGGQTGLLLMYLRKDDHAYNINDPYMKSSLTHTPKEKFEAKQVISNRFPIPSNKVEIKGCVHTFQELVKYINEFQVIDEIRTLKLIWLGEENLLSFLKYLYFECNFIPEVGFNSNHSVVILSFFANSIKIVLMTSSCGQSTFTNHSLNSDECLKHAFLKASTMSKLCNKYMKSSYGEGVKEMFQQFNRSPASGYFKGCQTNKEVIGIDYIKHYPDILMKFEKIPIFNSFDRFVKYKAGFDDFTLYYVEVLKFDDIMFNRNFDLLYGFTLKNYKDNVKILAQCTPSQIVNNPYKKAITEVFADDLLTEDVKKEILVSSIGYMRKQQSTIMTPSLYATKEDCHRDIQKYGGHYYAINDGNGFVDNKGITHYKSGIYARVEVLNSELVDGFLPISHMIYDMSRLKLKETLQYVESQGIKPLGVKTDAVFISVEDARKLDLPFKNKTQAKQFGGKDYIDGSKICNIGKLKMEYAHLPTNDIKGSGSDNDFEWYCANACDTWIHKKPIVKPITLENEYSMTEFIEIFDKNNKVCVKAKHAGSGKSFACLKYVKDKKHAIACPQNAQARRLQLTNYNAMTLYDLCGMRLTDDTNDVVSNNQELETYDVVLIEEGLQFNCKELIMLKNYMDKNPNCKFIINGDELQNDPIEKDMNPCINIEKYYTNIINSLFPVQIMLEIPKRYKNSEKIIQLRHDLFHSDMTKQEVINKYGNIINKMEDIPKDCVYISYYQDTRKMLNDYEHKIRLKLPEIYEGLILKANSHMGKGKNTRINKHFEYKITKISEKTFDLIDESSGLIYENMNKTWLKNFSYKYAFTGHSLQGDTIDKPIVIFDAFGGVSKKWLYVALTRNKDFNNVYVFKGQPNVSINNSDIDRKIIGYMRQDALAKRAIDDSLYVDNSWVLIQSKKQCHRCSRCFEVMNLDNKNDDNDWTIDRIDNNIAHEKDNCTLMCLKCNISKK